MPIYNFALIQQPELNEVLNDRDAVVVPVWNAPGETIQCIEAIDATTPSDIPLLIVDDCGSDRWALNHIAAKLQHAERIVVILRMPENGGFVGAVNAAIAATRGDLAIVNSDVIVADEWFSRLRRAAYSASNIGSVSTFTNNGTILSVPDGVPTRRLPDGGSLTELAKRVADKSLLLRPEIPVAVGHCFYLRRQALNMAGALDIAFRKGYGEEVDLSLRMRELGFRNIVADDVYVFHQGAASFGEDPEVSRKKENDQVIARRYPWYEASIGSFASDATTPFRRASRIASMALRGPRIAIEARFLIGGWTGTQQAGFQLICALAAARPETKITILSDIGRGPVKNALEQYDNLTVEPSREYAGHFDLVFRPAQLSSLEDYRYLRRSARVVAICQLDFIAYHNPSYHRSYDDWQAYRGLTELAMASVEGVSWISETARQDALDAGFAFGDRPSVVTHLGLDSVDISPEAKSRPASLNSSLGPFMLQIGVPYHHKGRSFSLRLLKELASRGWPGSLVFVSPQPSHGSSGTYEALELLGYPELRSRVIDLGPVTEAEKAWLVEEASLGLYPSVIEGFGFVPFENAQKNLATLSTGTTSLAELLPPDVPTLEQFDIGQAADLALRLLESDDERNEMLASMRRRAEEFSWERCADRTWEFLDQVLVAPVNPTNERWRGLPGSLSPIGPTLFAAEVQNEDKRRRAVLADRSVGRLTTLRWFRWLVPADSRRQRFARRLFNAARRRRLW